jgi:hypothetical protein
MAYAGAGLPGRFIRNAKEGETCEFCDSAGTEGVPATTVVQGETDSFGFEQLALCTPCNNKLQEKEEELGPCEWCEKEPATRYTRDPDEGSFGPVYCIGVACNERLNASMAQEI